MLKTAVLLNVFNNDTHIFPEISKERHLKSTLSLKKVNDFMSFFLNKSINLLFW